MLCIHDHNPDPLPFWQMLFGSDATVAVQDPSFPVHFPGRMNVSFFFFFLNSLDLKFNHNACQVSLLILSIDQNKETKYKIQKKCYIVCMISFSTIINLIITYFNLIRYSLSSLIVDRCVPAFRHTSIPVSFSAELESFKRKPASTGT